MNNNNELKQAKFLSVSALNRYLSYKFDVDVHLQEVYLEGEISNFKFSGKHMYFSLKDENSEISAMMFYPNNTYLNFTPSDGMVVQAVGKVGVYEKRGTYSIVIKKMIRAGIGLLYQQYLDLKDKLSKEGLFEQKYKKPFPEYINTVGVVTSNTGEAINDIISTLNSRMPLIKVVIYPCLVQGIDAPKDIVRALKLAYQNPELDCIIVGRGGGSFEDLSCFNDEKLARCLFESPIPTVSAVGHEGDVSICDFIASHRASTPTGAAMFISKNQIEVKDYINILSQRLNSGCRVYVNKIEQKLNLLDNSYALSKFDLYLNNIESKIKLLESKVLENSPIHIIEQKVEYLKYQENQLKKDFTNIINSCENLYKTITNKLDLGYNNYLSYQENNFSKYLDKLTLLNPLNIMKNGYSITYQNDVVISSVNDLNNDGILKVQYHDGFVNTKILEKKVNGE